MKRLLQRFTQWFNRTNAKTGRLWEDRSKSVIVEDGVAAKTISAYIDLNPVRAGMVKDPADYRCSSYGEAIGGGSKGNLLSHVGVVMIIRFTPSCLLKSVPLTCISLRMSKLSRHAIDLKKRFAGLRFRLASCFPNFSPASPPAFENLCFPPFR